MSTKTALICLVLLTAPAGVLADQIPPSFDWRDSSIFTPVKHQLNCGSCGEFAAVAVLEALILKSTGDTVDLSEQQIMDCVPGCGCASGCASLQVLEYIKENGIASETDYPYLNKDASCPKDIEPAYFVAEALSTEIHKMTLDEKKSTIKKTLLKYGPVATNMIFYQDLDLYRDGVYTYDGKSECQGGHWVLIVGWNDDESLPSGGYWICRNSWGDKWGLSGYFNSAYGDATGIDDFYIVYARYN